MGMGFDVIPIIGQEAMTESYGLGRVLDYRDDFPHQWVEVQPYCIKDNKTGNSMSYPMMFAPENVTLIMPGSGLLLKVKN